MAHRSDPPARSGLPRWSKITIIALLVGANLALLAFIWAIQTGSNLLSGADTDDKVVGALDPANEGHLIFLLVGSDSREGLEDLTNFGRAGGERSDVVMLVRADASGEAQMLSIPRDLRVEIPGHGTDKINAAYAFGGPTLLVETIKTNLGVGVNHYVEVDFVGFQGLIDEIGGVEIAFPNAARDTKSGLDVSAGTQILHGDQALAYARSRSYQELQSGSWAAVDANDIGRTQRQQEVMRAMMSRLRSPSSVAEAGDLATSLSDHMTIDSSLAASSPASLLWDFRGVLTGSIDGATLPTTTTNVGGVSYEVAKQPEAKAMLANFKSGSALASQPLRLEVLNGNGAAGAAGEMSQKLESLGFQVAAIGNAGTDSYQQTTVIVPEGSEAGSDVVSALGFGVVEFGSVDNQYDAVVIVGADAS